MLKREYEILKGFVEKPWQRLTFREAMTLSGKRSESYVYGTLKRFVEEGVLAEEKAGNVILYSLNAGKMKAQTYAGFVAEYSGWKGKHIPYPDIQRIFSGTPLAFYTLLVTGSYAKGAQRKDSDLDMAMICEDSSDPKRVLAELRHGCEMNIPRIHLYVFRRSEFLSMLLDRKANYGKEACKSNLILAGGQEYFRMIGEAISHGFNG
jgi:hypothetical protein